MWQRAVDAWRKLPSDADAVFDREVTIDVEAITPQVTWGTSPEHVIGVDGRIPDPQAIADPERRAAIETALAYMGLKGGAPIAMVTEPTRPFSSSTSVAAQHTSATWPRRS